MPKRLTFIAIHGHRQKLRSKSCKKSCRYKLLQRNCKNCVANCFYEFVKSRRISNILLSCSSPLSPTFSKCFCQFLFFHDIHLISIFLSMFFSHRRKTEKASNAKILLTVRALLLLLFSRRRRESSLILTRPRCAFASLNVFILSLFLAAQFTDQKSPLINHLL